MSHERKEPGAFAGPRETAPSGEGGIVAGKPADYEGMPSADVSASALQQFTLRLLRGMVGETELTAEERAFIADRRQALGDAFYPELVNTLTGLWLSADAAGRLWHGVASHREALTRALGRSVGLVAATADYVAHLNDASLDLTLVASERLDSVRNRSGRDEVTFLANRDAFLDALTRELQRAGRYERHLSLVFLAIDDFVATCESRGADFSDYVLRTAATVIGRTLRGSDLAGRYRGAQFAVMLPELSMQRAFLTAERFRRRIERTSFALREGDVPIFLTISGGVAEFPVHGVDPSQLLRSVEVALVAAQKSGGNRVSLPPRATPGR